MQKVCIQGLGFVGAAMAAAVARARDDSGSAAFDVVGVDLPTPAGQARVDAINAGRFPFATLDAELADAVKSSRQAGNLKASTSPAEYETCDIAVVDVHLDVDFDADPPAADLKGFLAAIATLGGHIRPGTLVIVETTVPPGTTENLVVPELHKALQKRGLGPDSVLVAHSYERVMPGRDYLKSITNFWRVYAGVTPQAADACERFYKRVINTADFPLTRLKRPLDSETAKVMENSYRAVNIAFIEEWARFAERAGVDLTSIIDAIRQRPTHRNLMRPGFGVGGYCLTKDPLLAGVGARDVLGLGDLTFPFSSSAVNVNHEMPRATLAMLRSALGSLANRRALLLGASYREDVADTRYSPSASFLEWAEAEGLALDVHDPLADTLEDINRSVRRDLPAPNGYDAVIFAVAHQAYRDLRPTAWLQGKRPLVIDANAVLRPEQIEEFRKCGCRLKIIGRGDL